jgi:hypothetical protein
MAINSKDFLAQTKDPTRQGLVQKVTEDSVFLKLLHFIPTPTGSYEYGEQTKLPAIAWRSLNQNYDDTDPGAVNPKVERSGIFGRKCTTDQRIQAGNPSVRANNIAAGAKSAGLFYDAACIHGNSTTDPKSIDGLERRLTGKQLITVATNGGALTLSLVDQLLDAVVGPNDQKVILLNKKARRKLKGLIVAAAGGAAVMDINASLTNYDGARVLTLDEDGQDTPILSYTEACGSSNVTTSIYCIRPGGSTDGEWLQGIMQSNMIETYDGGKNGVFIYDVTEAQLGLALFHGRAAARLKGILDA